MTYHCFDLTVNIKKTKVLGHPARNTIILCFDVTISDRSLEQVKHFPYLGSFLSNKCTSEKDVQNRTGAAYGTFGKLIKCVFNNKDLNVTQIMVHNIVISTLLYGCEAWILYRHDTQKLERFHQHKLRSVLNIK